MTDVRFRCDAVFEILAGLWADEFRLILPTGEVLHARIIATTPKRQGGGES